MTQTVRTTLHRLPKRGSYDRDELYAILDEALVCHIGFVQDGSPFVIPTAFGRIDDALYVHGSVASRKLRLMQSGAEVCVCVTLLDGLVLARSAFHHSMNYRSAVIFTRPEPVTSDEERMRALEAISEHIVPDRWTTVRAPNEKEMKLTAVVRLPIGEFSVKSRRGQPIDDEEDYELPVWAGVLPLAEVPRAPEPDPLMRRELAVPDHITKYKRPRR